MYSPLYNLLIMIFAFAFALIVLINVHEFGHYSVARLCKVKVLQFAMGFGRPLFSFQSHHGTRFVMNAFPIGGYVKMLDEEEGPLTDAEKPFAFNHQPSLSKLAIVAAGPLFNILFAIFLYFCVGLIGFSLPIPIIGEIEADSIAAKAGLKPQEEILMVQDQEIQTWQDMRLSLLKHMGESSVNITTRDRNSHQMNHYQLPLKAWDVSQAEPELILSLGIQPLLPPIPPVIFQIQPDSAAEKAGLLAGDRILKVDGRPVNDWKSFVDDVHNRNQPSYVLQFKRQNQIQTLKVYPKQQRDEAGKLVPHLGVLSMPIDWPTEYLKKQQFGFLDSITYAFKQTWLMLALSFIFLWKLLSGLLSIHAMSGPVGIAVGAGQSLSFGFVYYLNFLALVSISLATINFLPIPLLDGGHFFMYLYEMIRRKPISKNIKHVLMRFGFAFIVGLTFIALYNDLLRLFG